jgi:hypothetical protein
MCLSPDFHIYWAPSFVVLSASVVRNIRETFARFIESLCRSLSTWEDSVSHSFQLINQQTFNNKMSPMTARMKKSAILISLPLLAHADGPAATANFILPLGTQVPLAASIINVAAQVTTYALGCPANFPAVVEGVPKEELCPSLAGITVTQGPSTLVYATATNFGEPGAAPTMVKAAMNCKLSGTTMAVCTNSYDGVDKVTAPAGLDPEMLQIFQRSLNALKTPETATLSGDNMPPIGPVQITAGAQKLGSPASVSATATGTAGAHAGHAGMGGMDDAEVTTTVSVTSTIGKGVGTGPPTGDGTDTTFATSLETNPAGGAVNTSAAGTTSKRKNFLLRFLSF